MTILNQTNDGLFNILIVIVRCISQLGPTSKSKLLELVYPTSIQSGKERLASSTLRRWEQLGLFTIDDKEIVRVASGFSNSLLKSKFSNETLAECARHLLMQPSNNDLFWETEKSLSADFTRALAWSLAMDAYSYPGNYKGVEILEQNTIASPEHRLFTNSTRWSGFTSWAGFLGFGNQHFGCFSMDPTCAINSLVSSLVPKATDVPIAVFVESLSAKLPVLDRGKYRTLVEEKVRSSKLIALGENELSTSLSRAILRLDEDGTLEIENKADAKDKRVLLGRDSKVLRIISHVRLGSKKQ
ncbi:protein DpdG [Mariniblastus sp.]|nr:protein DpdG [Mariniblastus sp.]